MKKILLFTGLSLFFFSCDEQAKKESQLRYIIQKKELDSIIKEWGRDVLTLAHQCSSFDTTTVLKKYIETTNVRKLILSDYLDSLININGTVFVGEAVGIDGVNNIMLWVPNSDDVIQFVFDENSKREKQVWNKKDSGYLIDLQNRTFFNKITCNYFKKDIWRAIVYYTRIDLVESSKGGKALNVKIIEIDYQ